jgi:elongation factor P--beta-lysine ligase
MVSLKLVNTNNTGIDFVEHRDQLFYNKFLYRVNFKLEGVRYTYYIDTPDELSARIRECDPYSRFTARTNSAKAKDNETALRNFVEWRTNFKKLKLGVVRIESHHVSVFSNDLLYLKTIENIDNYIEYTYTEADANVFKGVRYFVEKPKHKHRAYLKSKKIDKNYIETMQSMLNNSTNLYPSKSFTKWLEEAKMGPLIWKYHYTSGSHYIDYDDENMLSYMVLMLGNVFGKRYKLEKRPDPI